MQIAINIIGVIAFLFLCIGFNQKSVKDILKFKLAGDIAWSIHYFLLGAYTGMAANLVNMTREIFFLKMKKQSTYLLVIFTLLTWLMSFVTWGGWFSILPSLASTFAVFSFWQKNVSVTRAIGLLNNAIVLTYAIFARSYMGIIAEITVAISIIYSLIKERYFC